MKTQTVTIDGQAVETPRQSIATLPRRTRQRALPRMQREPSIGRLREAFALQCDPTMGVELEFFLVDKLTGGPVAKFHQVYDRLPPEVQQHTTNEFLQCQIEYATPVCRDADECGTHLERFINAAGEAAEKVGARLLWRATLEDWPFDPEMIYDSPRSRTNQKRLGDKVQWLATCGMHVHVAVPRDQAIHVVDRMQVEIPKIVCQSANSPTMHGRPGVMASHRAKIWAFEFPMLTYPCYFGDWRGFDSEIRRMYRSGKIRTAKDIYLLARPSMHGTVEIRAADLPKDLATVVTLAERVQTAVINCQNDQSHLPALSKLWTQYMNACHGSCRNQPVQEEKIGDVAHESYQ